MTTAADTRATLAASTATFQSNRALGKAALIAAKQAAWKLNKEPEFTDQPIEVADLFVSDTDQSANTTIFEIQDGAGWATRVEITIAICD